MNGEDEVAPTSGQTEDQPVSNPRPEMSAAQAYEIVRRYSPGDLSREVQILLESLFE